MSSGNHSRKPQSWEHLLEKDPQFTRRDAALFCQWLSEQDPELVAEDYCYPEAIWDVEVLKVNTINRKGKRSRVRGTNRIGSKPDTKRAIVTLAAGEIPLFEN